MQSSSLKLFEFVLWEQKKIPRNLFKPWHLRFESSVRTSLVLMPLWWKFPNQGTAASVARWGLALGGAATLAWAFTTPDSGDATAAVKEGNANIIASPSSSPEGQRAEVSRWMQRTGGATAGSVLQAALTQVGPWATNQTAADNDVPAKVPSSKAR